MCDFANQQTRQGTKEDVMDEPTSEEVMTKKERRKAQQLEEQV